MLGSVSLKKPSKSANSVFSEIPIFANSIRKLFFIFSRDNDFLSNHLPISFQVSQIEIPTAA